MKNTARQNFHSLSNSGVDNVPDTMTVPKVPTPLQLKEKFVLLEWINYDGRMTVSIRANARA
jgi:hypothetical protein